jgi:hypothetical protein
VGGAGCLGEEGAERLVYEGLHVVHGLLPGQLQLQPLLQQPPTAHPCTAPEKSHEGPGAVRFSK